MLRHSFLFKQCINVTTLLVLALPRLAAVVPSPMFYTEFQVSAPVSPSLLQDLYQFMAELCLTMPLLPCSSTRNVTLS